MKVVCSGLLLFLLSMPLQADPSGFQVGDIIYSINKQLTHTFAEVFALVETNGKAMIMNIQRGNRELYLLLK